MHGDHSRKQPFYQQVRKLHSTLHNAPELQLYTTPSYNSTLRDIDWKSQSTDLQTHHSTHHSIRNLQQNQQRISTASTAKKENLQQRKTTASENLQIYKLTILRITASEIYSKISREFLQHQQRRKRIYSRENYSIWKSTDLQNSPFHETTALENLQQTSKEFLQQRGIHVTRSKYKGNNLQHLRQITQGPNKGLHQRGHIPRRI